MQIEIDDKSFRLRLDAEGLPYVLKQLKRSAGGYGERQYWGIVWANWHKGMPTGSRMKALNALGWYWDRNSNPCRWTKR